MRWRFMPMMLAVLALAVSACGANPLTIEVIRGSGNTATEAREIPSFSTIQVNLGADITLTQGAGESLSILADDNILPYIQTEVRGSQLIISTPNQISLNPSQTIVLNIGIENITDIEINGSSAISGSNLALERLTILFSGRGSTRLSGSVDSQTVVIRGEATIGNLNLASRQVTVDISGSGTIEVNASESLDITVAGMGIIRYSGDPSLTQSISGVATITQQD